MGKRSRIALASPRSSFAHSGFHLNEREFDGVKRAEIKDNWAIPMRLRIGIAPPLSILNGLV